MEQRWFGGVLVGAERGTAAAGWVMQSVTEREQQNLVFFALVPRFQVVLFFSGTTLSALALERLEPAPLSLLSL